MTARWLGAAIAIALGMLPSPAAADELRSAGALAIRVPSGLILGQSKSTTVRLRRQPNMALTLAATAGEIGQLVPAGEELVATWTLPSERWPRVAIIAALDDTGTVRDWLAVPLIGQGHVAVTTAPNVQVSIKVDGTNFGPVRANARGEADLTIMVRPGVDRGTTSAVGSTGSTSEEEVPLNVKPFATSFAICHPDGRGAEILSITPAGTPQPQPPQLGVDSGRIDAPVTRGPGWYAVRYHPDRTQVAKVQLTAGTDAALGTSCALSIPPERPSGMRLITSAKELVAGAGATIALAIELQYPGRRPPAIPEVVLTAELGTTTPVEMTTTTVGRAEWSLSDRFGAATQATITARLQDDDDQPITATTTVELRPAAAARIAVTSIPQPAADGTRVAQLRVRLVDRFDNAIRTANLVARAAGSIGRFTREPDGTFVATYQGPMAALEEDTVRVVDSSSLLTGATTIPLQLRRIALAARLGFHTNLGELAGPIASVTATARLPLLDARLFVGVETAVSVRVATATSADGSEPVRARAVVVPIVARLGYRYQHGAGSAWAGLDAGVAIARLTVSSASAGNHLDSLLRPAVGGFIGGGWRTGPLWLVAELGYLHAYSPSPLAPGQLGGVGVTAGVAFEL